MSRSDPLTLAIEDLVLGHSGMTPEKDIKNVKGTFPTVSSAKRMKSMTGKEFINSVANGKLDVIQTILDILAEIGARYCLIGGLAVNAYVEPVVS
jgi:hypothetical protein